MARNAPTYQPEMATVALTRTTVSRIYLHATNLDKLDDRVNDLGATIYLGYLAPLQLDQADKSES